MNRIYLHIIGWLIYFVIVLFYKTNNLSLTFALKHTAVAGGLYLVVFYSFRKWAVNTYVESKQYGKFIGCIALFLLVFTIFKWQLESEFFAEFYELTNTADPIKKRRFMMLSVLFALFLSTIFTFVENRMDKEKRQQAIINQQKEAQLSYLKSQINPHFLFNSLNNIYALAVEKSDKTPQMVLQLSDLLRYSIYEGQKGKVPLEKEVEQIQQYLKLFEMSQEEPPPLTFEIQGSLLHYTIEPMLLIPLVENCIKHGDFASNSVAFIHISLSVMPEKMIFITKNSKSNQPSPKDKTGGVGLQNIRQRLSLNYQNAHQFTIEDEADQFTVRLEIMWEATI